MECASLSRVGAQVGLATTFGKGTVGQLVATSFLSLLWFALQVKTSPYRFSEVPPPLLLALSPPPTHPSSHHRPAHFP
jgi:hypothetical protein